MPAAIIGNKQWMAQNPAFVKNMLAASFEASDAIKAQRRQPARRLDGDGQGDEGADARVVGEVPPRRGREGLEGPGHPPRRLDHQQPGRQPVPAGPERQRQPLQARLHGLRRHRQVAVPAGDAGGAAVRAGGQRQLRAVARVRGHGRRVGASRHAGVRRQRARDVDVRQALVGHRVRHRQGDVPSAGDSRARRRCSTRSRCRA